MKHTKKLTIFSIAVLCSLLLSLVFPLGALADDATPPPVETPAAVPPTQESVVTEEPASTEEPVATAGPLFTEEPTLVELVPSVQAATEVPATEVPVVEAPVTQENDANLAEIVAAADEREVVLANTSGDPLTLGSQEASNLLSSGDPFFWDGDSWEGYTTTGTGCPANVNCHQSSTPFQAAVSAAPSGSTIYVASSPTSYGEDVVINTANLSLQGYGTITVSAGSNTPTSLTNGTATTTSFTLNAVFGTTSGVFAPTVYVNPTGTVQDGVDLVAAGGTVYVASGTYQENVVIDAAKDGVTISGKSGDATVAGAAWDAPVLKGDNTGIGVDVRANNVTLMGLFIQNYAVGVQLNAAGNATFTALNNTIQNNGVGVFNANSVPGVNLHYNSFANNGYAIRNIDSGGAQYIDARNNYWGCAAGPVVEHTYQDNRKVWHTDYYQWTPGGQSTAQPIPGFNPAVEDCEVLIGDKEQGWNSNPFNWSPFKIKLDPIETTTEGCPAGYSGTYPNCVAPLLDAVDDSGTTNENTPVTTDVLANDSLGLTPTSVTGHTNSVNGTVSCTATQCTYTPNTGFTGTDTYTYTITDSQNKSDTATVTITVSNLPDAINDSATTNEGAPVTTDVLANDDLGMEPTTITSNTQGANGTVSCAGTQCTYTPNIGFTGTDSYTYTITDSKGNSDTATVTVTVVNLPDAINDTDTTNEGTSVTTDVLANDDLGTEPTTITSNTQGASGTVNCAGSQCTYTPNAGFVGTDSYTYTITDSKGNADTATVTITVSNLPDAVNDSDTTNEGVAVTTDVLANDDLGVLPTTITSNTQGVSGTISCAGSQCTYTPNAGFIGTDSYTYTITDSNGNTDTATVTITVVNLPDAIDDNATTNEGTAITTNVLANDDLGTEPTTITSNSQGANGTVSCTGSQCTYTPNAGFSGTDSYTYTITDSNKNSDTATVTVIVSNLPHAIDDSDATNEGTSVTTNVLTNDGLGVPPTVITSNTQGSNGAVNCTTTQCTYTPNAGFTGTDSYTYTITDSRGNTSTATVTITVINLPSAVNDSTVTNANTPVTTNVLANDDLGTPLTNITGNTNGINGTVSCTGTQCTYTPNAGFSGSDSYSYTITDSKGNTSTATVTVTVRIQQVPGCTDPNALNYNPNANVDDGSCIAIGPGCTDPTASNYNPLANVDDGSCIAAVLGCMDPTASNYNPLANVNNQSCTYVISGCMDRSATNYNPLATVSNGACSYSPPSATSSTVSPHLPAAIIPVTAGDIHAIAAGIAHTCAITPEGGVQCWGNNDFGQLGDGANLASNVPVNVIGIAGGMTIVAGGNHTCVLSSEDVWCWGQNSQGQLGDGTRTDRNVPVKVLSDAANITAGLDYTCAVMNNGQVMCWGNNDQGQLADGTKTDRLVPTFAALISGISNVDAGQKKSCGLTNTGLLECVDNGSTQKIAGSPEPSLNVAVNRFSSLVMALIDGGIPVAFQAGRFKEIHSVRGALDVDSGLGHVCTLIDNGTVECWGSNFYGQLGRNSLNSSSDPQPVLNISSAWQLAVGKYHACVMNVSDTPGANNIECWGLNSDGQLGNGTNVNSSVPVFVK